jgi:hypothetical protein
MITLICGAKGSGKTKRILAAASEAAAKCEGDVVYLTDQAKHSTEVTHTVRFVNYAEYGIKSPDAALGFLKGILSVNNDILQIYIDGLARMAGAAIADMEDFYKQLDALSVSDKADFILTVSCDEAELPRFMKKYV